MFHKDLTGEKKPKEKKHTPSEVQNAEWRITMINRLEHASQSHTVDPSDGVVCDTLIDKKLIIILAVITLTFDVISQLDQPLHSEV